jgi:DNA-binding transcriptional LysR family regulator
MLNEIDLSRADLNLLVLFEAVMRERNVGRAAHRLALSPSAVSHGLGRLRALLGDPLFLRTPRGMVPTERALDLAPRIDDALAAVRGIVATAEPFDPAASTRRFRIGTADAVLAVLGSALVAHLEAHAPRIGIGVVPVLPEFRQAYDAHAWDNVLLMLEKRELDIAMLPRADFPARFAVRPVGTDRLVAATRADHPFARAPSLDTYCAGRHMLVSQRGDPWGTTDTALAAIGRSRDVAITVPNFTIALFMAAESGLVVSLPESLIALHGARFGLVSTPLPVDIGTSSIAIVATKAATKDAGIAWLADTLAEVMSKR